MSAWIKMMPVEGARGFLKEMFDKVMTPSGTVDNVMRVHSLRPQTVQICQLSYRATAKYIQKNRVRAKKMGPNTNIGRTLHTKHITPSPKPLKGTHPNYQKVLHGSIHTTKTYCKHKDDYNLQLAESAHLPY